MNQNLKFKNSIFALTLSLAFLLATSFALGQGDFAPPRDSPQGATQLRQWNPPPANTPNQFEVVPASVSLGVSSSFPAEPHAFNPAIRTAKLDVPTGINELTTDATVDSTLDSTAAMLTNLKDATGEKLSGLMTTFKQNGSWSEKLKSITGSADIGRMLGSLALVLGFYFAFVWVMRKLNPNGNKGLPPEVIEVMGQVPFGARRNLQLVRLGSKLLLLMNSPEGTQPIGEITDPSEVEYLASLCPVNRKRSAPTNHLAAIQRAARNMVSSNPTAPAAPVETTSNSSNLANILRTLEQATKPNGTVFEA